MAAAFRLVGLNSIDFLVANDAFHLLEINPRPGATLDIFVDREGGLLTAHIEACRGCLPSQSLIFAMACATSIAYAPCDLASMPNFDWPEWCKDRQKPGTRLRNGDPVCTISGEAEEPAIARALVDQRLNDFREYLSDIANKENAA